MPHLLKLIHLYLTPTGSRGLFCCVFAKAVIVIGKLGAESATLNKERE